MFKLAQITPTFLLTVVAPIPNDKGVLQKTNFGVICKRLSDDEVQDLWKAATPPRPDEERTQLTDKEVVERVVVGFGKDVLGDDGEPLEYNAETHQAVFSVHPVTPCTVRAFFDYYMKAGLKNG